MDEIRVINVLERSGGQGIIGIEARERLQRLPSSVYWTGLGTMGIRLFPGTQDQYHRSFDTLARRRDDASSTEQGPHQGFGSWNPGLPKAPRDFPTVAGFALFSDEAEHLQRRIRKTRWSLLAHLVVATHPAEETEFVWTHPEAASFPDLFQVQVSHARAFSEAMHGAALLYNLLMAEAADATGEKDGSEQVETYRSQFGEWSILMAERAPAFAKWDRGEF